MKILHVVHAYPPSKGGSQWLTACLAEEMVARYGDEATVFTTVARNIEYFWGKDRSVLPSGIEVVNGVTVRRFPVFTGLNRLRWLLSGVGYRLRLPYNDRLRTWETGPFVPGLRQAVAASGADIVFATAFPLLHMYEAQAGARRGRIPIVMLGALHLEDAWGYDRPMLYHAIHQADAYIAHTPLERDILTRQHGVAAEKISVIGAGVNLASFESADGAAIRQAYGWGVAPLVTLLGKHVGRKRFDLLIEAMRAVWARHPEARLLLAGGRTVYTETLEKMVKMLPPAQQAQVTILPDFPEAQKPALLAATDIFVLPSTQESFGIALVEAWAAGVPVIGADRGAIADVIADGQDGLLFVYPYAASLAQAITTLLDNPAQRVLLGQNGLKKVRMRYTWQAVASQIRAIYERLVEASA